MFRIVLQRTTAHRGTNVCFQTPYTDKPYTSIKISEVSFALSIGINRHSIRRNSVAFVADPMDRRFSLNLWRACFSCYSS